MNKTSKPNGFTLIELLVVVSIIALLAGISLPAITGAMDNAKKVQATALVSQLGMAIVSYNTEYSTWPVPTSAQTADSDFRFDSDNDISELVIALNGNRHVNDASTDTIDSNPIPNPRAIQFMAFTKKDIKDQDVLVNPYQKAKNRQFWIVVDSNYNNITENIPDIAKNQDNGSSSTSGVAIWCWGDLEGTPRKFITNFK